ncbi:hypothetical protein L6R53_30705, partial [Myxococcota bacterium]|nr:hypothetical protein [Myxococcota bacterium]
MSIRIVGPWSAWDSRARRAQLVREDGSTAEVLLHPGGAGALPALEQARAEGRVVGAARHPAALHLKQVTQVGGASTWVFDGFAGASLARVSRELAPRGEALPLRLVAEVGVAVVDALGELGAPAQAAEGRQVVHPGPTPGMVLLSRDGQLKVAGFRAPPAGTRLEPPPGYGAPEGGQAPPAQVYAVGALLVELLGGEPPPAAGADADGHAAGVRRALIRVVSRPGPRAPEALVDLLRECLAFAPQARPSLPRLSVRLSRVVRDLPSPDLLTWARDALPRLWPALVGADAAGMDAPGPAGAAGAPRSAFGAVEVDPGLAAPTEAAGRGRALAPDDATASAGRGARSRPPEALLEHDTEEVERTRVRQEPAGR